MSDDVLRLLREQEALEAEQEVFDDLFEHAPVGYMVLSPDGQIRQVNPAGSAMLGEERRTLVGLWCDAFVPEPDRTEFNSFMQRLFQSGGRESCVIGVNNRQGRLMFVQMEGTATADLQECCVMLRDVTESRVVKETMLFNESKYRALFENLNVAFSYHRMLAGDDGKVSDSIIVEANPMYAQMLGRSLPDLIGRKKSEVGLFSLTGDFDWKSLYQRGAETGQPVTFEYYCQRLKQWYLVIAFVPSPEHMAYIYLDTTEIKKKDQQALESEKRYRSLVREANAIIMILNGAGEITFMNEYGLGFFGYRSDELIGKSIFGPIIRVNPAKPQDVRKLFKIFKVKIKRHRRGLIESLTRQGQRVLVDWTVQECQDFTGEEARFVVVGVDAIDAKKTQREQEKQLDRQRRRNLFNDGISRRLSHPELIGAARQLGIALAPPYVVGLLEISADNKKNSGTGREPTDWQARLDTIIEALQPWEAGAAWKARDGIAVVRSLPEAADKMTVKMARTVVEDMVKRTLQFGATAGNVRVGCAHSTHPMQSIAELYEQAYAALSFGPVINAASQLHHWDDLGFYQFIVKDLRTGMAQQFIEDQLGALLQMNRSGTREEMLDTLREIVSGHSAQLITEQLHIHRQTLVFRKKGLEKILGVDLDSSEVILNIAIALKMMSMSERDYFQS